MVHEGKGEICPIFLFFGPSPGGKGESSPPRKVSHARKKLWEGKFLFPPLLLALSKGRENKVLAKATELRKKGEVGFLLLLLLLRSVSPAFAFSLPPFSETLH